MTSTSALDADAGRRREWGDARPAGGKVALATAPML
eukprot:SAG11_NODE_37185_length_258_cov_0.647799_1_plen_35_part_10